MKFKLIIEAKDSDMAEAVCKILDNARLQSTTDGYKELFDYSVKTEHEEKQQFMDELYKHLVSRKEFLAEQRHQEKDENSDPYYLARLDEITNILIHFEDVKL
jgi:hypothetical protein